MITAIILAAGESRRMGQPKMLLPWKEKTVLTQVISIFQQADVEDICIVTGGAKVQVEALVSDLTVRCVFNQDFATGEMLSSIQCGIKSMKPEVHAVLIGLGDQPQVLVGSVRKVCGTFLSASAPIVVPSYQMRRGHPWLLARSMWEKFLEMESPLSPRDFLNNHSEKIHYINVSDPNILSDLDTPEEYDQWIQNNL